MTHDAPPATPDRSPRAFLTWSWWRQRLGLANRPPWTLARRLVVAVVCLLALVSIVIGFVSVAVLRASLMAGLDEQLDAAVERAQVVVGRPAALGITPTSIDILNTPAQAPGTLALVVGGTTVTADYFSETGAIKPVAASQIQTLIDKATTRPTTIGLGGELGEYRVVGHQTPNGVPYLIGLPLAGVERTILALVIIIAAVSIVGVVAVATLAAWIVRLALRPLQRVTQTAARVSDLPLDRGDVALVERVPAADTDPRTEVGRVGSAVNRMLEHVDVALATRRASENKVRQFVSDASHELRTPLASIRGYAELTRLGGHQLPPDVVHALARIESESVRMTGLVEDLLLLARLDEGRELAHKPVELTRLVVDAVSDAHAAGADHVWNLRVPDEPVEVIGDEARLRQVIANLLANARVHTPESTVVTVTLSAQATGTVDEHGPAGTAVLEVEDNGPGIPQEIQSTLFERFSRADTSRSRASGSTGLGLAIARGVVLAHGGEITLESRPHLTRFRVTLPMAGAGSQP